MDTWPDTERTLIMTTQLTRFTQWARDHPQRKYNSLMGMLFDPEGLNESFERQAANKAPGVDGVRKAEYGGDGLAERLGDLSARVRRLGYRPKPVRRVFIPKPNGGRRALGVPTVVS
jgi:retron-type reverse transcriptase